MFSHGQRRSSVIRSRQARRYGCRKPTRRANTRYVRLKPVRAYGRVYVQQQRNGACHVGRMVCAYGYAPNQRSGLKIVVTQAASPPAPGQQR